MGAYADLYGAIESAITAGGYVVAPFDEPERLPATRAWAGASSWVTVAMAPTEQGATNAGVSTDTLVLEVGAIVDSGSNWSTAWDSALDFTSTMRTLLTDHATIIAQSARCIPDGTDLQREGGYVIARQIFLIIQTVP